MGRVKHGENLGGAGSRSKLYQVWIGMRARCRDPKHISYRRYGALGIWVDPEWDDYAAFREWSYANGYEEPLPGKRAHLWIDRVDSGGPYSPWNCRWVSARENVRRTARYKRHKAFGEYKTLSEWADDPRCQCPYYTLRTRLTRGWDVERAIITPNNRSGIKHGTSA